VPSSRKGNRISKGTVEEDAPPNFPWWSEVDTGRRAKAAMCRRSFR